MRDIVSAYDRGDEDVRWLVPSAQSSVAVHDLNARSEEVTLLHPIAVLARATAHAANVIARLRKRRNAAEFLDVSFAGVVRGNRNALIAESIEEVAQVLRAGSDVRLRIEQIVDAEEMAGLGDDLHQTLRVLAGDQARPKIGFRFDDGCDELGRQIILQRLAIDDRTVRHFRLEELFAHHFERECARRLRSARREEVSLDDFRREEIEATRRRKNIHRFARNVDRTEVERDAKA